MSDQARSATCRCGQLRATVTGDPVRISVCHCLACKRRSGSAFSYQGRWPEDQVTIEGNATEYVHVGESGNAASFHFCPRCGGELWYTNATMPGLIAIPIGTFADPASPPPRYSVFENRKHGWLEITGEVEHD